MARSSGLRLAVAGVLVVSIGAAATQASAGSPAGKGKQKTVEVQVLALNDFHGNLVPPSGSSGRVTVAPNTTVDAGGAEYLATHVKALEATNPNTVVVSAGDLIGASPLISALFHDEPTIEAFNEIGLDFNAVGNHEFDEGAAELLRMQRGGCHPEDGCLDGDGFRGADFQFLAANVVRKDNGRTLFPAYKIRTFRGAKVAFIGMTLEGTPSIVTPSGISNLEFRDEADTVNALIPELKKKGVNAVVVVVHEGGLQPSPSPYNGCAGISGPIVDIVERFDPAVDLVITGHTHQPYNCVVNDMPVSSAFSFGRLVTDIDMTIDRKTGEPTAITVNNVIVTRTVAKDPEITSIIEKYQALAAPIANRVIGSITGDITTAANDAGESTLGDVIADAQLDATNDPGTGEAVIAFMNPGGIRANLTSAQISGSELPGEVTYGESFTVQPFGNNLVTMTYTGAQLDAILEQQFDNPAAGQNRILQVSEGFTYTWSMSAPLGDKVSDLALDGVPIDPAASYRVTMNSFLADGGDNFSGFTAGTDRLGGVVDTDALEAYFAAESPVAPGPQNRITVVP